MAWNFVEDLKRIKWVFTLQIAYQVFFIVRVFCIFFRLKRTGSSSFTLQALHRKKNCDQIVNQIVAFSNLNFNLLATVNRARTPKFVIEEWIL